MKWIFGSFRKDFLFLMLPGLLALLIVRLFPEQPDLAAEAFAFFALTFCDSGHVYTTFWRTYAIARERRSTILYFSVPAAVFLIVASWVFMGWPWLWAVVILLTVFHNYRQFHGILRWEQKVNRDRDRHEIHFLALLCGLPFLIFHFRDVNLHFYADSDLIYIPYPQVIPYLMAVTGLVWLVWIGRTLLKIRSGAFHAPSTLAVLLPAVLYSFAFIYGHSVAQVLFPLVIAHGIAYMGLMGLSLKRIGLPRKGSFALWFLVMLGTAFLLGSGESLFEGLYLGDLAIYEQHQGQALLAVAAGVYLVPLISHYLFDGWLWTSKHPDAVLIYANDDSKSA